MKNLFNEIKELAQEGLEHAIIARDADNKEIFIKIMLKAEIGLSYQAKQNITSFKPLTKQEPIRTYERISTDSKTDMYLVAYCFSYFEHECLYPNYSQDKAFSIASEKLGVKKNTLKNTRDWFDGHNNNHRSGWWQAPLPDDMEKAKKIFENKTRNTLILEAKQILGIKY